jgi:LytS/YehU family sensor histidine kinase
MTTRLILATITGAVLSFLLGWLLYGILLMDFFGANMIMYDGLIKEMPNLLFVFIAGLASWFMISFIFQRWAGFTTFLQGLGGGAFIGFFIGVSIDLSLYSMFNLYNGAYIAMDIAVSTIMTALIAGVVAAILGSGKKAAA